MKKAFLLFVLVATFIAGCKDSSVEPDPRAMGQDYYPLEIGDYRIYNVTDIRFRNNVGDTSRFQLRERVDTSFTDQTNTLNYKIVRSIRTNANSAWVDDSVMVVTKSNSSVLLTKDNTKLIKLVFPLKNGKSWSADAFNANKVNTEDDQKEKYALANVGEPFSIGDQSYARTATVIQGRPTDNLVQLDDRKEVYAEDIGMVYRLFNRVVYCNDSQGSQCEFGVGYKLFGHERHEVLVSYGNE